MDESTTHEPITDEGTRVASAEQDALPQGASNGGPATEEAVREALKHVVDPELGVNIVDLGLVYRVEISEEGAISIEYTLTTMGCPIGPLIEHQIQSFLENVPGVDAGDDVRGGQGRPRVLLARCAGASSRHRAIPIDTRHDRLFDLHLQFPSRGVGFVVRTRCAGLVAAMIPARLCGCIEPGRLTGAREVPR